LREYEASAGSGRAYGDSTGFLVSLPHRQSISPDASFYVGPRWRSKFLEGAPVFAAEVRSENDYGPGAERALAEKCADYFAAGTKVVWDVDVLREEVIRVYRASEPDEPFSYRRGQVADAEAALPGFRMAVDALFD
jgi:Uma2 family endonuclease